MKPNWQDAPEWANYLAQDLNGLWAWYECEPDKNLITWGTNIGRTQYAETDHDWENSLEARPYPENIDSDYFEHVTEKDEFSLQENVERNQLIHRLALSTARPQ